MVQKKTFIITILSICLFFIAIGVVFGIYHFQKIEEIKKEKEDIVILPNNEEDELQNIIVE